MHTIWSIPITGENFKSKGKVEPEFRRGVNVYFTDRSAKYQITTWPIFWTLINFLDQFGWLEQFSAKFIEAITLIRRLGFRPPYLNVLVCKIPTRQVADPNFCKQSCIIVYYYPWLNFKFVAFVVFEISGAPQNMLRLAKKRKMHEGLKVTKFQSMWKIFRWDIRERTPGWCKTPPDKNRVKAFFPDIKEKEKEQNS